MDDFQDLAALFADMETSSFGATSCLVRARESGSHERVVVKALNLEHIDVPAIRDRFVREGQILRTLKSRYLPKVLGCGSTSRNRPYLVLEYLEGRDLQTELDARLRLPPKTAIRIASDVCAALKVAHAAGVVHRDIKPGNIFLTSERAMLIDFGIAKAPTPIDARSTSVRDALGTPNYMAPEQVRCSARVDGGADVWSLGIVLFEMLTGRLPFRGNDALSTMKAILETPAPSLSEIGRFPSGLSVIVLRCLAKPPDLRWTSVDALQRALDNLERSIAPEDPAESFADAETMPLPDGFDASAR